MTDTKRPTAEQIAEHFIQRINAQAEGEITNMKLQKLLWFAQKMSLEVNNKPLFRCDFEAWKYGPVVPSVYDQYCKFGRYHIPDDYLGNFAELDDYDDYLIDVVISMYSKYSAIGLMKLSHKDSLYTEAWNRGDKSLIDFNAVAYAAKETRKEMTQEIIDIWAKYEPQILKSA